MFWRFQMALTLGFRNVENFKTSLAAINHENLVYAISYTYNIDRNLLVYWLVKNHEY